LGGGFLQRRIWAKGCRQSSEGMLIDITLSWLIVVKIGEEVICELSLDILGVEEVC